MLWKVRSLAPMVVVATFSAVPVVVVIVLTTALPPPQSVVAQTAIAVAPLTALNPTLAPVVSDRPPRNVIVAASLLSRLMPLALPPAVMAPVNVALPPALRMLTGRELAPVTPIVPA